MLTRRIQPFAALPIETLGRAALKIRMDEIGARDDQQAAAS